MKQKNNKAGILLAPLLPNAGVINWYSQELKKLVRIMHKATATRIKELYQENKDKIEISVKSIPTQDASFIDTILEFLTSTEETIGTYFDEKSYKLVSELMVKINDGSESTFRNAINALTSKNKDQLYSIRGTLLSEATIPSESVRNAIEASIVENVNLIKSIKSNYFEQITTNVMQFINAGSSFDDLKESLANMNNRNLRRAELIAGDQVRKAYSTINVHRCADAGIKRFKWIHSGSSAQPREYHRTAFNNGGLNGGIFDIDNPPIIDKKTGERGYPAQLPYCKCIMTPILDLPETEIE